MPRRALVALLAAGLVAAGCTNDAASVPDEPHELAPSSPPVEEPRVTVDTYPAVVDPAVVEDAPGAASRVTYDEDAEIFVAWPQLGLPPLDAALDVQVGTGVAEFRTAHGEPEGNAAAGDPAGAAELNGTWSLVGSSEEIVGVLTDTYVAADGRVTDTWATTWYAAGSRAVVANSDLLDDPEEFAGEVASALADQESIDDETLTSVLAAGVPVLAFTANGEMFVGFDEHQLAGGRTGRITVVLTVEQTDALLSDLGVAARAALLTPSAPPLPDGVAAPPDDSDEPAATGDEPSDDGTSGEGTAGAGPTGTPAVDCAATACVALTFDDGPGPHSADALAALAAGGAPATFFVLGQQVATYPEATAAIATAGHEIGIHTWDHKNLTRLSGRRADRQIARTATAINDATGATPTLFRPPYDATDGRVAQRAGAAGLAQVLSTIDARDWATADPAVIVDTVLSQVQPGAIVQLHELGPATAQALPAILLGLRERGLTPVTVSTLLGQPAPGATYTQQPIG